MAYRSTGTALAAAASSEIPPFGMYRVVFYPFVYVRDRPGGDAVAKVPVGTIIHPIGKSKDGWLPVKEPAAGWMLMDGASVGKGRLLVSEPQPSDMTGYRLLSPLYDKIFEVQLRQNMQKLRDTRLGHAAAMYFEGRTASLRGERALAARHHLAR